VNDELPQDEPEVARQPASEKTADDSGQIRYRGVDGEWRDLDVARKRTGDAELDELWSMSFKDFKKLLEDQSHPLHVKAKQVSSEMTAPIVEALEGIMRPAASQALSGFDVSKIMAPVVSNINIAASLPKFDTSWISGLIPTASVLKGAGWSGGSGRAGAVVPSVKPETLRPGTERLIDFDTIDPPDATIAEIQEAAEAHSRDILLQVVDLLRHQLEQARADASTSKKALKVGRETLNATREGGKHSRSSARAARVAALIAGLGVVATVVFEVLSRIN